ncbi:MAG: sensor histidine kinase, partial [Burkholderiales bacterium]
MKNVRELAGEKGRAKDKEGLGRPKTIARHTSLRTEKSRTRGQPSRMVDVKLVELRAPESRADPKAGAARAIANMVIVAQEEEKRRIAMDLHDDLGQTLNTIKFSMQTMLKESSLQSDPHLKSQLMAMIEVAQTAIDSVDRIATDLRPAILDKLGFLSTCRWMLRQFCVVQGEIKIDLNLTVKEEDISEVLKITLFRIIQEALNNIAKHSEADSVQVRLKTEKNRLFLTIEDNGVGYDEVELEHKRLNRPGRGLANMIYRAVESGGHCTIDSRKGRGTLVM